MAEAERMRRGKEMRCGEGGVKLGLAGHCKDFALSCD